MQIKVCVEYWVTEKGHSSFRPHCNVCLYLGYSPGSNPWTFYRINSENKMTNFWRGSHCLFKKLPQKTSKTLTQVFLSFHLHWHWILLLPSISDNEKYPGHSCSPPRKCSERKRRLRQELDLWPCWGMSESTCTLHWQKTDFFLTCHLWTTGVLASLCQIYCW